MKPTNQRIAIYTGDGADEDTRDVFDRLFTTYSCGQPELVSASMFTDVDLRSFSLVILPGGRGSAICSALGQAGKDALRRYVRGGGSVLGICAGAYALSAKYDWALKLLSVAALDTPHWARGETYTTIRFTAAGKRVFGAAIDTASVYYYNGPVIAPFPDPSAAQEYEVLATFEEDVVHPQGIRGLMPGSPAAILGAAGRGEAMSISPHIEQSGELAALVANAIRHLIRER